MNGATSHRLIALCLVASFLMVSRLLPAGDVETAPSADRSDPLPDGVRLRLGTDHLHSRGHIFDVAYSADGRWIASVSNETASRVWLWDAATGRQWKILRPDGKGAGARCAGIAAENRFHLLRCPFDLFLSRGCRRYMRWRGTGS